MDPMLAQIMSFGGNFAPRGWMMCNGQLMSIAQNTALFSLLGTTYGGDGMTTFALPDLRGRRALGWGQGPGLDLYDLGEQAGTENTTLLLSNLPAHTHTITLQCDGENAAQASPEGHYMGTSATLQYSASAGAAMANQFAAASVVGGSQAFASLTPYLAMTQCIATEGIYPSRN